MQCFMPQSNKVPDLRLVADKRQTKHKKKGNKDIEALQGTEYHLSR